MLTDANTTVRWAREGATRTRGDSREFVADFAAASAKLVVEVDGSCHARRATADARRDRALARLGWRVVRVPAALVIEQPREAVARVREALSR